MSIFLPARVLPCAVERLLCLALLTSENIPPNLYGTKAAKIVVFLCEKEPCHFGEGRREAAWLVGVCPSEPNGEKPHFYTGAGQK